jgi:hypothetical protein
VDPVDPGRGRRESADRPVLTIGQVIELAGLTKDRRFRELVLIAALASLR